MTPPIRAILWAQWRILLHSRSGVKAAGSLLAAIVLFVWFGIWVTAATALARLVARPEQIPMLSQVLPTALLMACVLFQVAPLLMSSQGATLDLKKLLAYPIRIRDLFHVDVLLRLTSGPELLLLLSGAAVGLALNPGIPAKGAPIAFLLLTAFNLCLAAGLRRQVERLMQRRGLREILALFFITAAALPQLLLATGTPGYLTQALAVSVGFWWPWTAAARISLGDFSQVYFLVLLAWIAIAWRFSRWQFHRSLEFEPRLPMATAPGSSRAGRGGALLRSAFSALLPDPVAALVEKDVLTFIRSPRFRLVFIMGFTFGVLIFLPMTLRHRGAGGGLWAEHRLTMVAVYALLLLGDAVFWNIFGFDRASAKLYFLAPHSFRWVLIGKNVAALIFVLLEVTGVAAVWWLLRMPVSPPLVIEAYAVTLVLCLYLLGAGNLVSLYYPRAASPDKSTGATSSFSVRILLLLAYPILAIPVLLAYGAGYAFQSRTAFYAVLSFAALLGAVFYGVALESATERAGKRKEQFLAVLAEAEGPVGLG